MRIHGQTERRSAKMWIPSRDLVDYLVLVLKTCFYPNGYQASMWRTLLNSTFTFLVVMTILRPSRNGSCLRGFERAFQGPLRESGD